MNNQFESFVETLRCVGVKSLSIEFQQTTPVESGHLIDPSPNKTTKKEESVKPVAKPITQSVSQNNKSDTDIFDVQGEPESKQIKKTTLTEKVITVENKEQKETTPLSTKSPYDRFWAINEEDDGGDQAGEQRRALIGLMTRDDILRINNDCELGIDTDQSLDQLRAELAACF